MSRHNEYNDDFYRDHESVSRASAMIVRDLFGTLDLGGASSVVDVGCGWGTWLDAFHAAGARRLVGLDGPWNADHFADRPQVEFHPVALDRFDPEAVALDGEFDVGISVEVVEHLPPAAAGQVIRFLADRCRVVLFSAAIPGQGGTGHQNEQWQSHWARVFARHGMVPYDLIRPRLWADDRVAYWYRQNLVIFAADGGLGPFEPSSIESLDLVHPELFDHRRAHPKAKDWALASGSVLSRGVRRLVSRVRR